MHRPTPFALAALALILALALVPAQALAQEAPGAPTTAEEVNESQARSITLETLLDVAVRGNPTLARSNIDISLAGADILASLGVDDWTLTAGAGASISRFEPIDGPFTQQTEADSVNLSAGLAKQFDFGGTFTVNWSGSADKRVLLFSPGEGVDPFSNNVISYNSALLATLTQPILQGFGKDIARVEQRRAENRRSVAQIQARINGLQVVQDLTTAYWELAYAQQERAIRQSSVELAKEQLRLTRAAIRGGTVAPTESLALEQAIASREEQVLLAEVNTSRRSLELRRLAGMEVGPGEINLSVGERLNAPDRPLDLDQQLQLADSQNPTVAILKAQGDGAKIDVEFASDGIRPRLDATATFGPQGSANTASDTVDQLVTLEAWQATARLDYTQVLGNRGAEGNRDRARENVRRLRVDLEEARRQVAVSVVDAVNSVRTARKRIEVSETSIRLAEQNIEVEQARFQAGRATNFDVLQRQNELEQSRLSYARAVVDYLQALTLLDSLTGDLLKRRGVEVLDSVE